ncbi:MAG: HEAT repeat domain-containing protein [Pirellulales bacterium]|nr:HEAT repeat domain-containing protein [Pirellulales bacterium]
MSLFFKPWTLARVTAVSLLVSPACVGCARWQPSGEAPWHSILPPGAPAEAPSDASPPPADAARSERSDGTGAAGTSFSTRSVLARRTDSKQRSVWMPVVSPEDDDPLSQGYRWQYLDLERLLAEPPARRPDFRRLLADRDPIVAGHAAIALARLGDAAGARRLAKTAGAGSIPSPMRCAAVEALAGLPTASAAVALEKLLEDYERSALDTPSNYDPKLHAELIRGLARHVDPSDNPRLTDALKNPAPIVQIEALRAWAQSRGEAMPETIDELLEASDPKLRAETLLALAKRGDPRAPAHLAAALQDYDYRVRVAAIAGLGELGGERARATLEGLLTQRTERIRAAAVAALARLGAKQTVLGAVEDESWRVRTRVAQALARWPDREGAAAADRLLADHSTQVQQEVVRSLQAWPLARAGPVLLAAMDSQSLAVRDAAAGQLTGRWPAAGEFSAKASAERRAAMLADLHQRFRRQFGSIDRDALAAAGRHESSAEKLTPQQVAEVERLLGQQDIESLVHFGSGLVETLEQLAFDRRQVLPEAVYRHVLPRYDPAFGVLDRLTSAELAQRRRAADELAGLAKHGPLGRLALARLSQLVVAEPDQLVWRSVLMAVSGDPREPAIHMAYAAIGHPVPEVRRRACENLAAQPLPEHAAVLLPALEDPNHSVCCAAVRALGRAGRMENPEPLRRLLLSTNEELRLETALTLARLGDPAGGAELQRLAYHPDPTIACRVAEAMGETGDASYLPMLIQMLDGRASIARAALQHLPKLVGRDVSLGGDYGPASTSERIRRWKQWYARQAARGTTKGPDELAR